MKQDRDGGIKSTSDKIVFGFSLFMVFILCAFCLYPFLIVLSSSLQTQQSIMASGYRLFKPVADYTVETYKMIFANPSELLNSYAVTIVSTAMTTVIGVLAVSSCGYVLSRKDYRYRKILSTYVFITMLFSGGMVASYILIAQWLNMKDTIWALTLPATCGAWNIMLCKGFFATIPTPLIESAKLDGAGEGRIFFSIVMPISKPAIATVGMMMTLASWNEYMSCMLYISDDSKLIKLQYMLMKLMANIEFLNSPEYVEYVGATGMAPASIPTYGARMAMCVLAAGPILLVFPFFQKYFVKGINTGGIKG